jgi:hypothetical protein
LASLRPTPAWDTVTTLWRLTTQGAFNPSSTSRRTSEATPRIEDVMGATVTLERYRMDSPRVRTRTGRDLSGGANR